MPTPIPTFTLIPATATYTPTPLQPTATQPPRINPDDLQPTQPRIPIESSDAEDPVAAEMIALAQGRVVNLAEDVQVRDIETISIESYVWQDSSLGCPLPDSVYTQVEVPGYRIVLAANDTEYIFHTSFTDLVRCARDNELLPIATD